MGQRIVRQTVWLHREISTEDFIVDGQENERSDFFKYLDGRNIWKSVLIQDVTGFISVIIGLIQVELEII